jgi:hypothetical protein
VLAGCTEASGQLTVSVHARALVFSRSLPRKRLKPTYDAALSRPCATGIGPSRASNNDALRKPFVYDELVARMRAVLRRSSGPRHARLTVGDLEIDLAARVVKLAGELVQLSAKEYELLVALAEDPERVFKKEELLRNVWGFRSLGRTHRSYPTRRASTQCRPGLMVGAAWEAVGKGTTSLVFPLKFRLPGRRARGALRDAGTLA